MEPTANFRMVKLHLTDEHYGKVLNGTPLQEDLLVQVRQALAPFHHVLVYGVNTGTGQWAKSLLGDAFVGFINSDTFAPDMRTKFDSVLIGTANRHYPAIMNNLAQLALQEFTVIQPFVPPEPPQLDPQPFNAFMAELGWLETDDATGEPA